MAKDIYGRNIPGADSLSAEDLRGLLANDVGPTRPARVVKSKDEQERDKQGKKTDEIIKLLRDLAKSDLADEISRLSDIVKSTGKTLESYYERKQGKGEARRGTTSFEKSIPFASLTVDELFMKARHLQVKMPQRTVADIPSITLPEIAKIPVFVNNLDVKFKGVETPQVPRITLASIPRLSVNVEQVEVKLPDVETPATPFIKLKEIPKLTAKVKDIELEMPNIDQKLDINAEARVTASKAFKPRGTDTVPAMLTPGEFVVNKRAAQANAGLLNRMNTGGPVYMAKGGPVETSDMMTLLNKWLADNVATKVPMANANPPVAPPTRQAAAPSDCCDKVLGKMAELIREVKSGFAKASMARGARALKSILDELRKPRRVKLDMKGCLFVCDYETHRLLGEIKGLSVPAAINTAVTTEVPKAEVHVPKTEVQTPKENGGDNSLLPEIHDPLRNWRTAFDQLKKKIDEISMTIAGVDISSHVGVGNLLGDIFKYNRELRGSLFVTQGITGESRELQNSWSILGNSTAIVAQTGQSIVENMRVQQRLMSRGVRDRSNLMRIMKTSSNFATMMDVSAEDTAEMFGVWHTQLGMSATQIQSMSRGMQSIARQTGISGQNVLEAARSSEGLMKALRQSGNLTGDAARNVVAMMASFKKSGVEELGSTILSAMSGPQGFLRAAPGIQSVLAQAAAAMGRSIAQLPDILKDRGLFRTFANNFRNQIRGIFGTLDFGRMNAQQRFQANITAEAYGFGGIGDIERAVQSIDEAAMTFAERMSRAGRQISDINDVALRQGRALNREERGQIEVLRQQRQALRSGRLQDFNDELRNLTEQGMSFGAAVSQMQRTMTNQDRMDMRSLGLSGPADALSTMVGDMRTQLLGNNLQGPDRIAGMQSAFDRVGMSSQFKDILKIIDPAAIQGRLEEAAGDPERMQRVWDEITDAQQTMATVQRASVDPAAMLQLRLKVLNAKLLELINKGLTPLLDALTRFEKWLKEIPIVGEWLSRNLAEIVIGAVGVSFALGALTSAIGAMRAVVALVSSAFNLLLKPLKMLTGGGAVAGAAGTAGGAAVAGAAGAGATGGLLSRIFKPIATTLGKIAKFLPFLDLGIGGLLGGLGAEGAGRGTLEGIALGALTGGADRGSMLSGLVGVDKGSAADDAIGLGTATLGGAATGAMIGFISGPVGAAVGAAIGGLVGFGAELYKIITDPASELGKEIKNIFGGIGDFLMNSFGRLGAIFEGLWTFLKGLWGTVVSLVSLDLAGALKSSQEALNGLAKAIWAATLASVIDAPKAIYDWGKAVYLSIVQSVKEWGPAFLDWMKSMPAQIKSSIKGWGDAFKEWIRGLPEKLGVWLAQTSIDLKPILRGIWNDLKKWVDDFPAQFKKFIDDTDWAAIGQGLLVAIGAIFLGIPAAAGYLGAVGMSIITVILEGVFGGLGEVLQDWGKELGGVAGWIFTSVGKGLSLIGDVAGALNAVYMSIVSLDWDTLKNIFIEMWNGLVDIVKNMVDGIIAPFRWLYNVLVGNSIIPELADAIFGIFSSLGNRLLGFITDLPGRIVSALSGAPAMIADALNPVNVLRGAAGVAQNIPVVGGAVSGAANTAADLLSTVNGYMPWNWFADGTNQVTREGLAMVHAGETIVPANYPIAEGNGPFSAGAGAGLRGLIESIPLIGSSINGLADSVVGGIRGAMEDSDEKTLLKSINDSIRQQSGILAAGFKATSGNASRGTDTVPAMLTPGEFVVNREAAQANAGLLMRINEGGPAYMAEGGPVGDAALYGAARDQLARKEQIAKSLFDQPMQSISRDNQDAFLALARVDGFRRLLEDDAFRRLNPAQRRQNILSSRVVPEQIIDKLDLQGEINREKIERNMSVLRSAANQRLWGITSYRGGVENEWRQAIEPVRASLMPPPPPMEAPLQNLQGMEASLYNSVSQARDLEERRDIATTEVGRLKLAALGARGRLTRAPENSQERMRAMDEWGDSVRQMAIVERAIYAQQGQAMPGEGERAASRSSSLMSRVSPTDMQFNVAKAMQEMDKPQHVAAVNAMIADYLAGWGQTPEDIAGSMSSMLSPSRRRLEDSMASLRQRLSSGNGPGSYLDVSEKAERYAQVMKAIEKVRGPDFRPEAAMGTNQGGDVYGSDIIRNIEQAIRMTERNPQAKAAFEQNRDAKFNDYMTAFGNNPSNAMTRIGDDERLAAMQARELINRRYDTFSGENSEAMFERRASLIRERLLEAGAIAAARERLTGSDNYRGSQYARGQLSFPQSEYQRNLARRIDLGDTINVAGGGVVGGTGIMGTSVPPASPPGQPLALSDYHITSIQSMIRNLADGSVSIARFGESFGSVLPQSMLEPQAVTARDLPQLRAQLNAAEISGGRPQAAAASGGIEIPILPTITDETLRQQISEATSFMRTTRPDIGEVMSYNFGQLPELFRRGPAGPRPPMRRILFRESDGAAFEETVTSGNSSWRRWADGGWSNPTSLRGALRMGEQPAVMPLVGPPEIPAMAAGGIVDKPTLALIGEAGPEAVIPLSRNTAQPLPPSGAMDMHQRVLRDNISSRPDVQAVESDDLESIASGVSESSVTLKDMLKAFLAMADLLRSQDRAGGVVGNGGGNISEETRTNITKDAMQSSLNTNWE